MKAGKKDSKKNEPLRLVYLDPAELEDNPQNWRAHPEAQTAALRDVIADVGWAGALLYNERTKRLIDGHARKQEFAGKAKVPVLVGDWSEEDEKKILATLDPLGAMAGADAAKLEQLLEEANINDANLLQALGMPDNKKPKPVDLTPTYGVIVHVPDETAQRELLHTADAAGFDATAILTGIVKPEKIDKPLPPVKKGATLIKRETKVERSARVRQVEGMFDLPKADKQSQRWELQLELPNEWSVGLIVGPSGSGKSTIAREWFRDAVTPEHSWSSTAAVVDGFPESMSISDVTHLLSSVGFSSPPGWLKPFHVLSTGEQFRVTLARCLAEQPELAVMDEFTSVVDRTVAKIGSHAAQKAIRATGRRFVAVSCHYDVIEWLQPDWILDVAKGEVTRRSLRRRPELSITVRRAERKWWQAFRIHHYLSHELPSGTTCFLAEVDGQPASFCAVGHKMGKKSHYQTSRLVTLPTYQGAGIGHALHDICAGAYRCRGKPYTLTSSHPAMIAHLDRSPHWTCTRFDLRAPYHVTAPTKGSAGRMTASFRYVGHKRPDEAERLGIVKAA